MNQNFKQKQKKKQEKKKENKGEVYQNRKPIQKTGAK